MRHLNWRFFVGIYCLIAAVLQFITPSDRHITYGTAVLMAAISFLLDGYAPLRLAIAEERSSPTKLRKALIWAVPLSLLTIAGIAGILRWRGDLAIMSDLEFALWTIFGPIFCYAYMYILVLLAGRWVARGSAPTDKTLEA